MSTLGEVGHPTGFEELKCLREGADERRRGTGLFAGRAHTVGLEVFTEVGTRRSFRARPAHMNRMVKWNPRSHAGHDGRSWDRTSDLPRVKQARRFATAPH